MKHTNTTYLTEHIPPGSLALARRSFLLRRMGIRIVTISWLGH
jgi:hypothetical protein